MTKQDPKITGLIMSSMLIIENIELFPDKINPDQVEKAYMSMHKACQPKDTDISQLSKISKNINDTYHIVNGISKNMQMCLNKPPD